MAHIKYLILPCCLTLTACAPKSYVALLPNADGTTGALSFQGAQSITVLDNANTAVDLHTTTSKVFNVDAKRLQADFGAALNVQPTLPVTFLLYFETGALELTPESKALLPKIYAAIAERPAADISVIGHTDTVGPEQLNAQLAQERAHWVSQLFAAQRAQLKELTVTSHGERNLLVATPDETSEPRNRRVEVSVR